jgi:hypothetical protein
LSSERPHAANSSAAAKIAILRSIKLSPEV